MFRPLFLSIGLALFCAPAFAEDLSHLGGGGTGGRSIADPIGQAKLFQLIDACSNGRPGAVGGFGGGAAAAAQVPSNLANGNATSGEAVYGAKCLSCHGSSVAPIQNFGLGVSHVSTGVMPKSPSPPLSETEKADVIAFLRTQAGI